MPKPPRTYDFVTYVLNSDKKLRFKLKLMGIREDDKFREFIMTFCLGNDHITIQEIASGKNSGFGKGKFMSSIRLRKPGTSVDDQKFYGTKDFALGAQIHVRGIVFIITGLDLWTYNYMNDHPEMFTKEAIEGAQKYIEDEGLLNKQETTTIENVNKNLDVDDTKNLFGKEVVVEKID
ncbi:EF-hand domain-containing protein 1-like [Daktulosphaira vitifoliae]|uniref:EF-hand domain-containing protein 1-like n=1 Tax=Daktulosphaira vitifoliae TaxID=58002 RepID=UPI0021AA5E14|nr:EF-hand domain-containing protein 1-like [Daktulosphaira vitifoliae]